MLIFVIRICMEGFCVCRVKGVWYENRKMGFIDNNLIGWKSWLEYLTVIYFVIYICLYIFSAYICIYTKIGGGIEVYKYKLF